MANIRKIQHISNQYLLNLPVHLVRYAGWQKGDYLEVISKDRGVLEIRKCAGKEEPRSEVVLAELEQEAAGLSLMINATGARMGPGTYSFYLAKFAHVAARARKLRRRMNERERQEMGAAIKM